ncbi:ALP1-like protein [Tanacetum coccineum]
MKLKGCLVALDGTSIRVTPPSDQKPRYQTRKSNIATNVLGVFCPNMQFIYVLPGWEGSTHDGRVLRDDISRDDGLKVPQGCYYLVDVGYCNASGFLAPFRVPNSIPLVAESTHEQTDDELTEKEAKQMEADDQAIQTILSMAAPVIAISSDVSEESVGSVVSRVILFDTIPIEVHIVPDIPTELPSAPELPAFSPFLCSNVRETTITRPV